MYPQHGRQCASASPAERFSAGDQAPKPPPHGHDHSPHEPKSRSSHRGACISTSPWRGSTEFGYDFLRQDFNLVGIRHSCRAPYLNGSPDGLGVARSGIFSTVTESRCAVRSLRIGARHIEGFCLFCKITACTSMTAHGSGNERHAHPREDRRCLRRHRQWRFSCFAMSAWLAHSRHPWNGARSCEERQTGRTLRITHRRMKARLVLLEPQNPVGQDVRPRRRSRRPSGTVPKSSPITRHFARTLSAAVMREASPSAW